MRLVVTRPAARELEQIARYVEQDDPIAAERLILEISGKFLDLRDHPQSGQVIGARRSVSIRRLVHRPYLILYSVSGDVVRVHRVIHGARSPRLLLKGLDPL